MRSQFHRIKLPAEMASMTKPGGIPNTEMEREAAAAGVGPCAEIEADLKEALALLDEARPVDLTASGISSWHKSYRYLRAKYPETKP